MYPLDFFNSFWRNDFEDCVFVAMSFHPAHEERWTSIFKPAIESIAVNGNPLQAHRVDTRQTGQAIHTEILNGIAHSQLVLADISVQDRWIDPITHRPRSHVNDNVMYEVGIAMTSRQPVEVLLVRDDIQLSNEERPPFDVLNIPYVTFHPSDPDRSIDIIRENIKGRLNERNLRKDLRFTKTLQSLSSAEVGILMDEHVTCTLDDETIVFKFEYTTMKHVLANQPVPLLLQKQLIHLVAIEQNPLPAMQYRLTDLGVALVRHLMKFQVNITKVEDAMDDISEVT